MDCTDPNNAVNCQGPPIDSPLTDNGTAAGVPLPGLITPRRAAAAGYPLGEPSADVVGGGNVIGRYACRIAASTATGASQVSGSCRTTPAAALTASHPATPSSFAHESSTAVTELTNAAARSRGPCRSKVSE